MESRQMWNCVFLACWLIHFVASLYGNIYLRSYLLFFCFLLLFIHHVIFIIVFRLQRCFYTKYLKVFSLTFNRVAFNMIFILYIICYKEAASFTNTNKHELYKLKGWGCKTSAFMVTMLRPNLAPFNDYGYCEDFFYSSCWNDVNQLRV